MEIRIPVGAHRNLQQVTLFIVVVDTPEIGREGLATPVGTDLGFVGLSGPQLIVERAVDHEIGVAGAHILVVAFLVGITVLV